MMQMMLESSDTKPADVKNDCFFFIVRPPYILFAPAM